MLFNLFTSSCFTNILMRRIVSQNFKTSFNLIPKIWEKTGFIKIAFKFESPIDLYYISIAYYNAKKEDSVEIALQLCTYLMMEGHQ